MSIRPQSLMCWNSWTSVSAMLTGDGGRDVAMAPKAAGEVALSRSDRGTSGTMTGTPSAIGPAAHSWWRTSSSQAAWIRCRQFVTSAAVMR